MIIDTPGAGILNASQAAALGRLLTHVDLLGYSFITPTPASHARVLARNPDRRGESLSDILGWSLPFWKGTDPLVEELLEEGGMLKDHSDGRLQSKIRVSLVHDRLFIHSAYPTDDDDAVILGPDTYRFADLIERSLADRPADQQTTILDIGTGAGVGAVVAADLLPRARVIMTDINPRALAYAQVNAGHARREIESLQGRNLAGWSDGVDIVLANPPYVVDPARRAYRDGGEMHGAAVAVEMAQAALAQLRPGGTFILYTGSPIIVGEDPLKLVLEDLALRHGAFLKYRELDPDVCSEELGTQAYRDVDRIALVSAIFRRR